MPRKTKLVNIEKDDNSMYNFYELPKVQKLMPKSHNPCFKNHQIKVPFRAIFIGATGSGKTNTFMNILDKMRNTFNHIYIYTRAEEVLYDYLISQIPDDLLTIKYSLDDCRKFKEADYYGQSLVVFDDMVNEKNQKCIHELFIRGRKIEGGISLLYLSQSYFNIPKIVRQQCQYVFIIKVSGVRDLKMMLSEYALTVDKHKLIKMYNKICSGDGKFSDFLMIDLNAPQNKSFRKNFKEIIDVSNY